MGPEVFKPIKGYEKYYLISDIGRVYGRRKKMFLKGNILKDGYKMIRLYDHSTWTDYLLHRIVGRAFVQNPENKPYINHRDGNKLNNDSSNLEWVTAKENVKHAFDTGLQHSNEKHNKAKLTNQNVIDIRDLLKNKGYGKPSFQSVADKYQVCKKVIQNIFHNKTWTRLGH